MVITPEIEMVAPKIILQNGELAVLEQYKYLGVCINTNTNDDTEKEIISRIKRANREKS